MNKPLYELVNDLTFLNSIDPEDEEQEKKVSEMLEKVNLDIEQKAIGIAKYIINIKGYMEMIKAEEDRLHKKQKAAENRMESLKSYLFKEMRKAAIMQIKGDVCTVSIKQNPPSVEVIDVDLLPEEFKKITVEAKKKEILDLFKKDGVILSGINIITDKESIQIR
jgi:RNA recognition motif-containing protein